MIVVDPGPTTQPRVGRHRVKPLIAPRFREEGLTRVVDGPSKAVQNPEVVAAFRQGATTWRSPSTSPPDSTASGPSRTMAIAPTPRPRCAIPTARSSQTFPHPADFITLLSRANQNVTVNLTEPLGTASLIIGSLTSTTVRPDQILVNRVSTTGNVTLTANQTITEANDDVGNDIVANQLTFDAGTGIGTSGNPIETQVAAARGRERHRRDLTSATSATCTIGGATAELRGLFTGTSGDISLTNSGLDLARRRDQCPDHRQRRQHHAHGDRRGRGHHQHRQQRRPVRDGRSQSQRRAGHIVRHGRPQFRQ